MGSLNRAISLTNYSLKKGIIITWVIALILDLLVTMANLVVPGVSSGIVTGSGNSLQLSIVAVNALPFIIYFITNSMIIFSEGLPVSISYGLTRKNFFIAMILNSLIISVIFSVIQGILFKVEPYVIDVVGKRARENFAIFNLTDDNVFFIIAILFLLILAFISVTNLIVGLNSKFGFKLWLILVAVFLLLVLANRGLNISFGLSKYIDFILYGKSRRHVLAVLGGVSIVSNILNFLVIKFTNIKYQIRKA